MRFWDSSAVVALLVAEPTAAAMREIAEDDPAMIVWWATQTECASALARLERQGDLSTSATSVALERLDTLVDAWSEIQPVEAVRGVARRLLRTQNLRAAEALQLAAAVVAAEGRPASLDVVTLDDRLTDAAGREGFVVRGATAPGVS